jgi:hypothetical protein
MSTLEGSAVWFHGVSATKMAQVELRSGRVYTPAADKPADVIPQELQHIRRNTASVSAKSRPRQSYLA